MSDCFSLKALPSFEEFKGDELQMIEKALECYLGHNKVLYDVLWDSMEYSVSAGGKRVRPMLTLDFCRLCGEDPVVALPFACAVEFIHTYSLIHDDLPCMDDDDMRRGRPSNHIAFSESTALLAGDALQSLAFEIMLCEDTLSRVEPARAARAAGVLAHLSGADGMVGGQVIDLMFENKACDKATITQINDLKTGGLIKASCMMGAIIAGADEDKLRACEKYAECIGLTFQIVDDILDVTSTADELGKPINSDIENNKSTLVSLYGIEKCRQMADEYTALALKALDIFDSDTSRLRDFAVKLRDRKH